MPPCPLGLHARPTLRLQLARSIAESVGEEQRRSRPGWPQGRGTHEGRQHGGQAGNPHGGAHAGAGPPGACLGRVRRLRVAFTGCCRDRSRDRHGRWGEAGRLERWSRVPGTAARPPAGPMLQRADVRLPARDCTVPPPSMGCWRGPAARGALLRTAMRGAARQLRAQGARRLTRGPRRRPSPAPRQIIERLTERRIAVEKAVTTLGEAPSGLRDVFELCRGFERAFSNIVNVRPQRRRGRGANGCPPQGARAAEQRAGARPSSGRERSPPWLLHARSVPAPHPTPQESPAANKIKDAFFSEKGLAGNVAKLPLEKVFELSSVKKVRRPQGRGGRVRGPFGPAACRGGSTRVATGAHWARGRAAACMHGTRIECPPSLPTTRPFAPLAAAPTPRSPRPRTATSRTWCRPSAACA